MPLLKFTRSGGWKYYTVCTCCIAVEYPEFLNVEGGGGLSKLNQNLISVTNTANGGGGRAVWSVLNTPSPKM